MHLVLFYKYLNAEELAAVTDLDAVIAWQQDLCTTHDLHGRVLCAPEGVNGTLSGSLAAITAYRAAMDQHEAYCNIDYKTSTSEGSVHLFPHLSVLQVDSLTNGGAGMHSTDCVGAAGCHLTPTQFNHKLKQGDDPVLIDCRNTYEYDIGHFSGAINPCTQHFAQFADFVDENAPQWEGKEVLMYCTGGIRCEKASAYVRSKVGASTQGVYQLQGGIHKYLEEFGDDTQSCEFKGLNFVFDRRVAVSPEYRNNGVQPHDVVGECAECSEPWETLDGNTVCSVCHQLVLVCSHCADAKRDLFCATHKHLQGAFVQFVDECNIMQLKQQLAALEALTTSCNQGKSARRTVHRKRRQVEERLTHLEAGAVTTVDVDKERCRVCLSHDHSGTCWGFWRPPVTSKVDT